MKRRRNVFFFSSSALLVLFGACFVCLWLLSQREGEIPFIPERATLSAASEVEVGTPVIGTLRFELPVGRSIRSADVRPGDGSVLVGAVRIERGAWKFTRWSWNVRFELRAFRAGKIAPGRVRLELSGNPPETVERNIPEFSAKLAASVPDGDLKLADAIPVEKPLPWGWIALGTVFCLSVLALAILLIRKRRTPAPPLWERMRNAIEQLKSDLASGELRPEDGYCRLANLLRSSLEERYGIPFSTWTTPEFLAGIDAPASPLPKEKRPFLRQFLASTDLVKFAALTPEPEALESALEEALALAALLRPVEKER